MLAAITLPLGLTSSSEYAEPQWPIDILIALVWVAFGINMFATIYKRREYHLYVADLVLYRYLDHCYRPPRGEEPGDPP